MLDYDYLARPVKLVPRTLEAMPTVEDGGRTYVCTAAQGHPTSRRDPAFKGKPRELTAADYAYSFKRHLDPASEVAVAVAARRQARRRRRGAARSATQDRASSTTTRRSPGLEVVDRYTLRIRLNAPDLRFPYVLAVPNTGAVAREVVEALRPRHRRASGRHRTVPARPSTSAARASCSIANPELPRSRPTCRPVRCRAASQPVAAALKGKPLPLAQRVEISIIEEGQARWLAFLNGEIDGSRRLASRPSSSTRRSTDGKLKPELAAKGIRHDVLLRPNTYLTYFNMEDPVVGGYTPEKIALRRAIGMALQQRRGDPRAAARAARVPAHSPIPPDIAGYDPDAQDAARSSTIPRRRARCSTSSATRIATATAIARRPTASRSCSSAGRRRRSAQRQADELWKKNMDAIGLRDRVQEGQAARASQDGAPRQDPDARRRLERRLSGRRELHAAAVRAERRPGEPVALQPARVQRALRAGARAARFAGAHGALQPDDRARRRLRAVAPDRAHPRGPRPPPRGSRNYVPHPIRSQVWMFTDVDRARIRSRALAATLSVAPGRSSQTAPWGLREESEGAVSFSSSSPRRSAARRTRASPHRRARRTPRDRVVERAARRVARTGRQVQARAERGGDADVLGEDLRRRAHGRSRRRARAACGRRRSSSRRSSRRSRRVPRADRARLLREHQRFGAGGEVHRREQVVHDLERRGVARDARRPANTRPAMRANTRRAALARSGRARRPSSSSCPPSAFAGPPDTGASTSSIRMRRETRRERGDVERDRAVDDTTTTLSGRARGRCRAVVAPNSTSSTCASSTTEHDHDARMRARASRGDAQRRRAERCRLRGRPRDGRRA